LVLAERTSRSSDKDTRNGVGKTTLIEIIHYCLGADSSRGVLSQPILKGWIFYLDLELGGRQIEVARQVGANQVSIEGDTSDWPIQPQNQLSGSPLMKVSEWTRVLGHFKFGLSTEKSDLRYAPTFRSLVPYFMRRGKDAFVIPFEHHRKQSAVERQVNNAFLLGLAWEDAVQWQDLKEKKALLQDLQKAAKAGLVNNILGTVGELEAAKVRLQEKARQHEVALRSFKVHPQYRGIEQRAGELTSSIHERTNEIYSKEQMLAYYRSSLQTEREPAIDELVSVYEEAGLNFPEGVARNLADVQEFHSHLVKNRREYLASEIQQLETAVARLRSESAQQTDERAQLMNILRTHGALEEYSRLQDLHTQLLSEIDGIENRIQASRRLQQGRSELRVAQELLERRARADLDERRAERDRAISLFNANSEFLYDTPGVLVIDINENGFVFDVQIERSKSDGIGNMKIFCYDLMLIQFWAQSELRPDVLIHDSLLFDPVDPRQVALALELAAREAQQRGFQYICTLNSDVLDSLAFRESFDISEAVRLILTDADEKGSLLGIRF
jgi:uncharacterized protein YydD (DUF2326 family)